jgi:hypothetical protein
VATRQEITDAIDAGIAAAWPEIEAKQEAFFAQHGRYFQGLCTHRVPPEDGQPAQADRLGSHPNYQTETWLDVGYDPGAPGPRAALAIDQYVGPAGAGYVCKLSLLIGGDYWVRRINNGPEADRSSDWQIEPVPRVRRVSGS